ncbi:MAG TPA: phosphoribosyl-AMP cyclohydrolase [Bordetella sp.]
MTTDAATGDVLMLGYMNAEALCRTIEAGEAHYWSRSLSGCECGSPVPAQAAM